MPTLARVEAWAPPEERGINWDDPITDGLVFCIYPSGPVVTELVRGVQKLHAGGWVSQFGGAPNGNDTHGWPGFGARVDGVNTAWNFGDYPQTGSLSAGAFTMNVIATTGTAFWANFVMKDEGSGNGFGALNRSGNIVTTGSERVNVYSFYPTKRWFNLTGVHRRPAPTANRYRFRNYINGAFYMEGGDMPAGGVSTADLLIAPANADNAAHGIGAVQLWKRPLSEAEVFRLHEDPYCILNPPGPKLFYIALGASGPATWDRTATVTGSGAISGTGVCVRSRTATLAGSGAISATGVCVRSRSATLAGTSTIAANGYCVRSRTATITSTGAIDATGVNPSAVEGIGCGHIVVTQPMEASLAVTQPMACSVAVTQPHAASIDVTEC